MPKKKNIKRQVDDLPSDFLSSKEMFNHAFEFAPIGMTIVGPKGDFWKANRTFCEFIGYSAEEICSMKVFDVTYPEDRKTTANLREELFSGNTLVNREEKRYVRKDGKIVWGLMTRSVAYATENEIQYTMGHIQDITELKHRDKSLRESEERYRSLIETSPEGVVVVASNQEVVYANQQAAVLYATENPESLIGLKFSEFVHPDHLKDVMQQRDKRIKEGRHSAFHTKHKTIKGDIFDAEVAAVTIPWDGQEAGLLIIRDISELLKLNRLKDEFVSTVSHELRTPLTSIKGSLGLIRSETLGELPEKIRSMIDVAYNNSDRLGLLINDLLDIQKLDSGNIDLQREKIDTAELVSKSIEANKGYSDEYKVSFILKNAVPGIFIEGDKRRLMQVLFNLLSNAAKFSPEKSTVELSIAKQNGQVVISVSDKGCGIAQEHHDQIFNKFTQVDATDSRQKGGSGLGLSISKSIIEQHGGSIGFDSEIGKGSTFYFALPLFT